MPIKKKYSYNPISGQFDQITDLSDLNDTDIEVTANGLNKPLKDAIEDGDIGGSLESYSASIVHGETIPLYDWSPSPTSLANMPTRANGFYTVAWSPDGALVATADFNPPFMRIFKFNSIAETLTPLIFYDMPSDAPVQFAWSPDGKYLAAGLVGTASVEIYRRYGDTLRKVSLFNVSPGTAECESVAFSPDGKFLAIANGSLHIYSVSDTAFTKQSNPAYMPSSYVLAVGWSPDNKFLSVGQLNSPRIINYAISNSTFTKVADPATLPATAPLSISWSPDSSILALGLSGTSNDYASTYTVSGSTFTLQQSFYLPFTDGTRILWSPDGKYLAIGMPQVPYLHVHQRSGSTYTQISTVSTIPDQITSISWSTNGRYLAIAYSKTGTQPLIILKTTSPDPAIQNKVPEIKSVVGDQLFSSSYLAGSLRRIIRFSSSGTYTLDPTVKRLLVIAVGGGGNGGASANTSPISQGCGGGGGGYAQRLMYAHEITADVTVTVGGAGGTSSFGSFFSATGGSAGSAGSLTTTIGGNGGTASGAFDLFYNGGKGGAGSCGTYFQVSSGEGGHSALCAGGGAARKGTSSGATTAGDPGQANTGGGGSGGCNGATTIGTGGAGGTGVVIVYEYGD